MYTKSMKYIKRFGNFADNNFWWVAGAVVALASTACLLIGLHQSVWFDEAYSVMVAKRPVGEIVQLAAADTHPPLYYLALHAWMHFFGSGELAIRSLSLVGYIGTLVTSVWLMKRWFGDKAAWMTLALVAVSPLIMRYGFEARMYSLASFVGLLGTVALFEARKKNSWKWWVVYAALVALGTATLYNLVYLWVTHLIWLVWTDKKQHKLTWKAPWIKSYALAVVLFLPQLPTFFSQLHNGALAAISQPMTLDNLLSVVTFNTVYKPVWALDSWASLAVVAILVALTSLVVYGWRLLAKAGDEAKLIAMYLVVPVVLLTVVSLARPLYVERYLSHVTIGGAMFVALLIMLVTQKYQKIALSAGGIVLVGSLIGIIALTQTGNFNFQRMQLPNVAAVAREIDCRNGAVATSDPYTAIELQYYLPACQIHFYAEWNTLGGGYAPLNGSTLQSKQKEIVLSEQKIYFAYYDRLGVTFPGHAKASAYGTSPLHLELLSVD